MLSGPVGADAAQSFLIPERGVMTALVVPNGLGSHTLHVVPMTSVALAREEFGPTLADAQRLVDSVMCTECGTEACETEERLCRSCGMPGCRCIVFADEHARDSFFCTGCGTGCGCRECFEGS